MTASRFRTTDQIIPLLAAFAAYRAQHEKNAKLVLIGPFQERVARVPKKFQSAPNVEFLGTVSHADLPAHLRAADAFLLTHKTPPCPNNVLEAMACGLPIGGVADGAMPELVTTGVEGELVPEPAPGAPFPVASFADQLASIMSNQAAYARQARERAVRDFALPALLNAYDLLLRNAAQPQPAQH